MKILAWNPLKIRVSNSYSFLNTHTFLQYIWWNRNYIFSSFKKMRIFSWCFVSRDVVIYTWDCKGWEMIRHYDDVSVSYRSLIGPNQIRPRNNWNDWIPFKSTKPGWWSWIPDDPSWHSILTCISHLCLSNLHSLPFLPVPAASLSKLIWIFCTLPQTQESEEECG